MRCAACDAPTSSGIEATIVTPTATGTVTKTFTLCKTCANRARRTTDVGEKLVALARASLD